MLTDFAHCPGLEVDWGLMRHIVAVESSFNTYAIGVVGAPLARQPDNLQQAVNIVARLSAQGHNFSVGLAQINVQNFAAQGLQTYEQAFEPCTNLRAGTRILAECQRRYPRWEQALSCYYSGNAQTGFDHGYVQNIVQRVLQAAAGPSAPSREAPLPAPTLQQRRLHPSLPLPATPTSSPLSSGAVLMLLDAEPAKWPAPKLPGYVLNMTTQQKKNP